MCLPYSTLVHSSFDYYCNQPFFLNITPNNRFLRGVACSHQTLEGGASRLFSIPASLLMSCPSIISLGGVVSPTITIGGGAFSNMVMQLS